MPFVSPENVYVNTLGEPVLRTNVVHVHEAYAHRSIWYPATGNPPEFVGEFQFTVTKPSPEIARNKAGAPEGPKGIPFRTVAVPSPCVVTGVTRKR